jgi:tripartite-type tricarboxylate transporter receptor subunit TctC
MKSPKKKIMCNRFVVLLLVLALFPLLSQADVFAQKFPSREIEMVINYGPGGSTDLMARLVGNNVSKLLGVPLVYNNRPGGGGAIAANYIKNAKPDGYTVGTGGAGNLGMLLVAGENIPYTLKDFSGLARAATLPFCIVTKKGRFENFEGFVKEAKQKPGTLAFASYGAKGASHIMGELINQVAGIKVKHVPFDSGAKAAVGALGGHVDIAILTTGSALSNVKAGTLTALAVSSENRAADYPDTPSLKELGYAKATFITFDGFVTSSKVPAEQLSIIQSAFEKSIKLPEIQEGLKKGGMIPGYLSGEEYDVFLKKSLDIMNQVAIEAKIK